MINYICKVATKEEMEKRWDNLIKEHPGNNNWVSFKETAIKNFDNGYTIPYYGFLDGKIICEATATLKSEPMQDSEKLVGNGIVYLSAFRTQNEYQGKGYFSKLFKYMIEDLKNRGYEKVTLGVEPEEEKNKEIYNHYGFTEYIKKSTEIYPDGTEIQVEYYGKSLK